MSGGVQPDTLPRAGDNEKESGHKGNGLISIRNVLQKSKQRQTANDYSQRKKAGVSQRREKLIKEKEATCY